MDMHALPTPPLFEATTSAELLARADALRDRRDWAEAAQGYAGYLRLRGEDWPIWIQYGHCMKEAGDPRAALLLYREAERLRPEDADLHLQIGHALKLLGRHEEALEEYARALTLDPGNAAARHELLSVEPGDAPMPPAEPKVMPVEAAPPEPAAEMPPAATPISPPMALGATPARLAVVFDASDLLDYFRHNRAPTGIQRVQLNLIREALGATTDCSAAASAFDPQRGIWVALPAELFLRLAALSRSGTDIADPAWAGAMAEVQALLREAPPLAFAEGAHLVNLGTSWWIPDYLRRVREAKARFGLRYIPFIHDCIPLIVPEHCSAGLVEEFARWFASMALHADAVLTNSECTRADFRTQLRRLLPSLDIPAYVLPLDAVDAAAPDPGPSPAGGRPFVLFVGTIESRKNHLLVLNAWLGLVRKHGPDAVPDLVCVGKRGWLAEAALALHANSATLRAKVRLLHNVPDTALEALYRDCLFTVYNSFYEGWGLPVTESLAHGKVPVVPDHSALREAGGTGALYFAPQSEPELVARLEQMMFDPGFRQEAEARIRNEVRLRRWPDLAQQLLDHIGQVRETLPPPFGRLGFRLGEIHELRLLPGTEPRQAMAVADALREGPGWDRLESWGVWTTPAGPARLRLPLPPGLEGTPLRVTLEMQAPPQPCRVAVRAHLAGSPPGPFQRLEAAAGERLFCTLAAEAGADQELVVEFEAGPGVTVPAAGGLPVRQVGIGVGSLMVCREDDLWARLEYLERKALPRRELV